MDGKYIDLALIEARKAMAEGDVPVGAVVVLNGEVIGVGRKIKRTAVRSFSKYIWADQQSVRSSKAAGSVMVTAPRLSRTMPSLWK